MNENTVVVQHEWLNALVDIIHFFLRHSTIEFDGPNRVARVKYNGPKGWKVSLNTTFAPPVEREQIQEVIEQWHD